MNMKEKPTVGFEKLQFLLQQNPCPPGIATTIIPMTPPPISYRNLP
jgi:hypothetical protein